MDIDKTIKDVMSANNLIEPEDFYNLLSIRLNIKYLFTKKFIKYVEKTYNKEFDIWFWKDYFKIPDPHSKEYFYKYTIKGLSLKVFNLPDRINKTTRIEAECINPNCEEHFIRSITEMIMNDGR